MYYKACNITEFVLKLEQKLLIVSRLKRKICVKMLLPLIRLLSDLVFFVMRTILYFLGFCVRLHYFLYYLSFIFNQFFTKCIVSSLSFSFFLFCVKVSDRIVSNVSRVFYTFVNSVIVN